MDFLITKKIVWSKNYQTIASNCQLSWKDAPSTLTIKIFLKWTIFLRLEKISFLKFLINLWISYKNLKWNLLTGKYLILFLILSLFWLLKIEGSRMKNKPYMDFYRKRSKMYEKNNLGWETMVKISNLSLILPYFYFALQFWPSYLTFSIHLNNLK